MISESIKCLCILLFFSAARRGKDAEQKKIMYRTTAGDSVCLMLDGASFEKAPHQDTVVQHIVRWNNRVPVENPQIVSARQLAERRTEERAAINAVFAFEVNKEEERIIERDVYDQIAALVELADSSYTACIRLAIIYENGFGIPTDLQRAKYYYERAAELERTQGEEDVRKEALQLIDRLLQELELKKP